MCEESADCQAIQPLPGPLADTVVAPQESHQLFQVAPVRDERVRGNVSFFFEMDQELFDPVRFAHDARATGAPNTAFASIQLRISASALSANISRLRFLSRIFSGRASRNPTLAFIGWKCF